MDKTAEEIFNERHRKDALIKIIGDTTVKINSICPFNKGELGAMVFIPSKKALETASIGKASLLIIPLKLEKLIDDQIKDRAYIISSNIGVSHARLKQKYADHNYEKAGWERIHASAIIHPSVTLPDSCRVGPNVVIEKGALIGKNVYLMANVVIEHGAKIGKQTVIHPGTIIGWDCEVGEYCHILSNSVIGGEGFGYAQDENFNHHRIPQTGKVIIGNKVTIGAVNTIDRATYDATVIGDGCIFDNMCHVAHNVKIGKNCIILSGFLCAGSTILGNRVVASGGTMIKDHLSICDNTYLVHRAGVVKNITQPGIYAGSPVLPMQQYIKSNAIYRELSELRKIVLELSKKNKS